MLSELKQHPNRRLYIDALARMTPEQRLAKAFELSDMTHDALRIALRLRHPDATQADLDMMFAERLERCRRRDS